MMQLLGSEEGKDVSKKLVEELNETAILSDDNTLQDDATTHVSTPGIFKKYPLLRAIFLESSR